MEKKNWSNPELRQAEVVDTHETECNCGVVPAAYAKPGSGVENHHYCHHNPSDQHSGSHTNDPNPKPNDHFMSVNCPDHGNNCCCYRPGQSS